MALPGPEYTGRCPPPRIIAIIPHQGGLPVVWKAVARLECLLRWHPNCGFFGLINLSPHENTLRALIIFCALTSCIQEELAPENHDFRGSCFPIEKDKHPMA